MQFTSKQILDNLPFGVIVADPKGRIVSMNPAMLLMLGYRPGELRRPTLSKITPEEYQQLDQRAIQALLDGEENKPYVKEFTGKAGDSIPVEVSGSVLRDDHDQVTHVLFSAKNLSKEMKLLNDLQRRNMHLLASSMVARDATQILDVQELLTRTVDLIRTHFGFYYAAIFLIDAAGEWAVLRAATGEAGQRLLARGHKLGVGSQSMVGWVTANNQARIALDVGEEAIRFDNPELPETHSEMALPLRVRGQVIGALDVQSTSLNAFTEEDITTIQMMADQVAIAIENARLFTERQVV